MLKNADIMLPIRALVRLAALAAALAAPLGANAQSMLVNIGTVADLRPYNALDTEGEVSGFEADLAALICTRAGLDCSWVPTPRESLIPDLENGDIDAIMSAWQITPARKNIIDFSDPYISAAPAAVLVLEQGNAPSRGSVVGALSGSSEAGYIPKQGWSLSEFINTQDALQALRDGEIGAFLGDQANLQTHVAAAPSTYRLAQKDIAIKGDIAFGVRVGSPTLLGALNRAIASVKADGTLDTLIGKWFKRRDPVDPKAK